MYVILADKRKVKCLGTGTTSFYPDNKQIILHDVLHVLTLFSPLLSVRCFHHLKGYSFMADNNGILLTFPTFVLYVDDSSNYTITGSFNEPNLNHPYLAVILSVPFLL